ncbi:hypothetical protein [Thalassospira xiamenensis]|uniref:Uncharacterized protein n=1 Tax=Thalassospira xiamenensis TaxID=220697 RepID=A0ABR5XWE1_9PROT|nr:hypothetical protein [Thalassospira xiamenensis]KZC97164.1 hypothetical protein AUP40_04300 [Thalassospira xiamenensis]KZD10243.1 hypothetical protein AUP45_02910 [Thalassospira xiamenensis]MCD1593107.1 hypothetical protein [Thalassospira xiamenensis]
MRTDIDPDLLAQLSGDRLMPVLFGRIGAASDDVRMWTGIGPISWGGFEWLGGGEFVGISEIEETEEIQANGLTFQLSGIPIEYLSLTLTEMRQGLPGDLHVGAMSDTGVLIGTPYKAFSGLTDVPVIDDDATTITISVTVESDLVDLERSKVRRFTDEDQKAIYPDDRGFEFVNRLQDTEITWGQIK